MQKQKINYLTLQSNYDQIELGLFEDLNKINTAQLSKFTASSGLIPMIDTILKEKNLDLNNLDFMCANLGPAPFTTLRTTIVTINGISFATKIPLVGVNGLQIFTQQALPAHHNLVTIFNAFNKSVYFGIRTNGSVAYGWQPIDILLNDLKNKFGSQPVTIIGQGLAGYMAELTTLPTNFVLDLAHATFPSIDLIARQGLELYLNQQTSCMLTPLYLKQAEPFK